MYNQRGGGLGRDQGQQTTTPTEDAISTLKKKGITLRPIVN